MRMSELLNEVNKFELDEGFSPREIKMAIGIASDKRYAGGNMTGAVKAIEKMKKGLSDHPKVAAVLRRQNEDIKEAVSPAQQAAIAISKKEKAKKEGIELDEYLTPDEKKLIAKMYDKKGNLTPLGKKVMDYKIKKEEIELDEAKLNSKKIIADLEKGLSIDAIVGNHIDKRSSNKDEILKVIKDYKFSNFKKTGKKEEVEENALDIEDESDYTLDEGKMKDLHGYISTGKSAEEIAKIMKIDVKTVKTLMNDFKHEGFSSDAQRKAAFASGYKEKDKKDKKEDVKVTEGYFDEQKSSTGYDLYHKDFSGAMQHAYAHAKKKLGITIDPDEISDKVATGPSKPSKGKTNSYRLKGDKGSVQIQVYNMGSKFELNMYKEEIEIDELTIADVRKATEKAKKRQEKERKATGKTSTSTADLAARRKNKKEEVEIDEEFELQEASIQMVAKDVEKLAKEVGKKDMDYSDFIKVAKMMRSNQEKDMVKYVGGLDTAPRDEIIMMVKNILGKKTAEKMFKVSIFGEEVELDEAKSQGMFIVLEKGSKNKVIGQFKDKRKAVDMMKKNAGSKVIQIGKFATADDKPVDIKVGDELSYTRVKLATKVKEEVELDEVSKEGTMRVIDLARQNNPEVRKHLNVANAGNKGYQVQRMNNRFKFVNQGKPYSKLKDAQKAQQSGEYDRKYQGMRPRGYQFETIDESVKLGGMPAGLSKERIKADRDVYAQVLEIKEAIDPADFDISATSKDVEKADQNIMIQLQKVITLRGQKPVEFADGKKEKVHPNVASAALSMHRKLRRTDQKDAFQRKIGKSYRDLLNAVKGK